ncbi:50S ribosomal protein L23 [Halococcus sp. AFM35]|uniref:50S ribosomal protein L23 n=1 Tax=Halococcus sp. AFM35 TaxID=3421653 RepID=UPI003EB6ED9D
MTDVKYPYVTEKAMNDMDYRNTLQFVVASDATKPAIREEVEERFDVAITNVRTQVTPQGAKKATVTLSDEDDAQDVASRIGVF